MVGKKYHLKSLLKQTRRALDGGSLWSDRYRASLKPNSKNLFKPHKVPELKQRFLIN